VSIPQSTAPTTEQIRLFYILNAIDLALTVHGIKHPNIQEGNPIVGEQPSTGTLILYKFTLAPLLVNHMDSRQMNILNTALGLAVLNNIKVINHNNAW